MLQKSNNIIYRLYLKIIKKMIKIMKIPTQIKKAIVHKLSKLKLLVFVAIYYIEKV